MNYLSGDNSHEDYQQTQLGHLPISWEIIELGQLAEVKGGKRLPKGHSFAESATKFPYLRVTDFEGNSIKFENLKYLNPDDADRLQRYIITSEDVYISIAGTIGLTGIVPKELSGANLTENSARLIIKDKNILDKHYLAKILSSDLGQTEISSRTTKTSQPKLALMRIKQIPIPLPRLPEQKAIAHILSTVQRAKEATEQVIQATKELKKSLMKHLFTYGAVSIEEAPKVKLKETEIGMVPEEWEVMSIEELLDDDIIHEIQDGNHGEKHPKQKDFTNAGIPFLTANCIRNSKVLFNVAKLLDEKWLKKLRIGFARPNDVLLTHKGTIGESAILESAHQVVILSPQVTYYRVKDTNKLNPLYLLTTFQSESFISQLKAYASTQSTRAYVGIKNQGALIISLPSPNIQKQII